jgi:hypothetical protein
MPDCSLEQKRKGELQPPLELFLRMALLVSPSLNYQVRYKLESSHGKERRVRTVCSVIQFTVYESPSYFATRIVEELFRARSLHQFATVQVHDVVRKSFCLT